MNIQISDDTLAVLLDLVDVQHRGMEFAAPLNRLTNREGTLADLTLAIDLVDRAIRAYEGGQSPPAAYLQAESELRRLRAEAELHLKVDSELRREEEKQVPHPRISMDEFEELLGCVRNETSVTGGARALRSVAEALEVEAKNERNTLTRTLTVMTAQMLRKTADELLTLAEQGGTLTAARVAEQRLAELLVEEK